MPTERQKAAPTQEPGSGRRILHLASYCRTNSLYGHLFRGIAHEGFKQSVYSPRGPHPSASSIAGCDWYDEPVFQPHHRLWFTAKTDRYLRMVKASNVVRRDGQLIHAHTLFTDGFPAAKLWKTCGTPYAVTVRSTDINIFARYFPHLRAQARHVLENASLIIFVNNPYVKQLERTLRMTLDAGKVHVIPNGIDEYWLNSCPDDSPVLATPDTETDEAIEVVCVAAVRKRKNQEALIQAAHVEPGRGARAMNVTFIGDDGSSYARRLKSTYETSPRVRFLGRQDKAAIRDSMRRSDVFALVSRTETFGLVYAEALSQGLPIVYTKDQGFDGWHDDPEIGRAYSADGARPLRQVIESLASAAGPDARSKRVALAARFEWRSITGELARLYRSVLPAL